VLDVTRQDTVDLVVVGEKWLGDNNGRWQMAADNGSKWWQMVTDSSRRQQTATDSR